MSIVIQLLMVIKLKFKNMIQLLFVPTRYRAHQRSQGFRPWEIVRVCIQDRLITKGCDL